MALVTPATAGTAAVTTAVIAPSRAAAVLTVAERLQLRVPELTPAERKVARVLLADYPVRGLEPIAKLAADAGVSAPTVVRLVTKLEFDSYGSFQQSLKTEVSARLSSPRQLHADRPQLRDDGAAQPGSLLSQTARLLCDGIISSFERLPQPEFEQAVRLLADSRRDVTLIGGRFSTMLAEYLAAHLRILRSHVRVVSAAGPDRFSSLLDVGRRDLFVAFDYRRYQHDTVRLAAMAKSQGATLITFTDPYLSPLAAHADVILTTSVQSPSPFDALTPAVALVEALIAALVDRLGDGPLARMARYDALFAGTVAGDPAADTLAEEEA
ncbi:MAG TPA: MurR/RpiR family transcriptional regulator [Streptosporangiaceae bacterium]|jgi:DNA-binding MurR/RpiR family transcriptional regulator